MDKLLDPARGFGREGETGGLILMEPIGFAVSLLPTVPQEIMLVQPPPRRSSIYAVHTFSYKRWDWFWGLFNEFFNSSDYLVSTD